jgi:AcrR family transcriptional regulator
VRAILDASALILESDGLQGFNTNAIAAQAKISIGSLYQYFPNKDAVIFALITSFENAFNSAMLDAIEAGDDPSLRFRLRILVRAHVTVHYNHPRLHRILESEEDRLGSGAKGSKLLDSLLQLLRGHQSEIATPVNLSIAQDVLSILGAVVDRGLMTGSSRQSAEYRALRAVCGYLLYRG